MKLLLINGVNLNMLGVREPEIYGKGTLKDLENLAKECATQHGAELECFQSNHEGVIVEKIHQAFYDKVDGIVINPGAFTHTSVAILDALKAVNIPTIEVHISDISAREEFRKHSYISIYAEKVIAGQGFNGYCLGIKYLIEKYN